MEGERGFQKAFFEFFWGVLKNVLDHICSLTHLLMHRVLPLIQKSFKMKNELRIDILGDSFVKENDKGLELSGILIIFVGILVQ